LKRIVEKLGGDYDHLRRDYEKVSGTLKKFGFSEYESRAYLGLVALGPSSAGFVADIAQIPRTSAYKVMKTLQKKGFVREQPGRPRSFAAVDPVELAALLKTEVEESFAKIGSLKDLLSERGVPQLVYTIMGKDRVLDKITEMLDKSQHTYVISSPSLSVVRRRVGKRVANAVTRGVRITVITSPFVKAPQGVKVIRRKGLIATDVISDGRMALLAAPDLSACGYTDNEALSRHLEDFLNIMGASPE